MADNAINTKIIELAADLTVAWLSNRGTKVAVEEVPSVIVRIHDALTGVLSSEAPTLEGAVQYAPAVSIRRSLASKDHIISLIDGKPYKMLRRHLAHHCLTPDEYRRRYGLRPDYPMVSEGYAAKRRELANKIGLGRKAKPESVSDISSEQPATTSEESDPITDSSRAAGTDRSS